MKNLAIAASIALAGVTSPSAAQNTSTAESAPYYDIAQFDVVGVRIGMRPDEVLKILIDRGFEAKAGYSDTDFFSKVRERAWSLKQPVPEISVEAGASQIAGYDAQGNHVLANFIGLDSGPELVSITLTFNIKTNRADEFDKNIAAKYGPPSTVEASRWTNVWCTEGDSACQNPFREESRVFYHHWFSSHAITLTNRGPAKAILEKQITSYFSEPTADRQRSLLGAK